MKLHFVSVISLSMLFSSQSMAAIVSGEITGGQSLNQGGSFIKLTTPFINSTPINTVGNNTFQTPDLYGLDENQSVNITTDLSVNILADGLGGGTNPGVISNGSIVASHYIFFDPLNATTQTGNISFDANIIGIITSRDNLLASDLLLNSDVTYLNPLARGLESREDSVSITNLTTITVDWKASTPGDYIRVLTVSPVPVPAAVWLFGSGLIALAGISRRKKYFNAC